MAGIIADEDVGGTVAANFLTRSEFAMFVSQIVLREAARGDLEAVERRRNLLEGIPVLHVAPEAESLSAGLIRDGLLPGKAMDDALHLSVAAMHGMDFLLTWNCKHLANAELIGPLEAWLLDKGLHAPTICTPDELLEKSDV